MHNIYVHISNAFARRPDLLKMNGRNETTLKTPLVWCNTSCVGGGGALAYLYTYKFFFVFVKKRRKIAYRVVFVKSRGKEWRLISPYSYEMKEPAHTNQRHHQWRIFSSASSSSFVSWLPLQRTQGRRDFLRELSKNSKY